MMSGKNQRTRIVRRHGAREGHGRDHAAELLDVTACARLLGLTPWSVRKRVARRQLPFRKLGKRVMFLKTEILALLDTLPGYQPDEITIR